MDGVNGLLDSAIFRHNASSNHILLFGILGNECLLLLLLFFENILLPVDESGLLVIYFSSEKQLLCVDVECGYFHLNTFELFFLFLLLPIYCIITNTKLMGPILTQAENWINGVGSKMFTIAGPVIVYGVVALVIYGVIYWIFLQL